MRIIINWEVFVNQIENFIGEADTIFEKKNEVTDTASADKVKEEIKYWDERCYKFLQESFDSKVNEYAIKFQSARIRRYKTENQPKDLNQIRHDTFGDLRLKQKTLQYYKKVLGASDAIIKPDEISLKARKNYDTKETLDLILDKLYELYDDHFYSVKDILKGNGIELKRSDDDRELIKLLEAEDLVNSVITIDASAAQLTPRGKIHVEDKRRVKSVDYNQVSGSQAEISTKINAIINELEKIGLGQEILYEELEKLKELHSELDKKDWGQLLKGKLFDLGISKAISPEVVGYVYRELTEQKWIGLTN